jgi:hypothetical protein
LCIWSTATTLGTGTTSSVVPLAVSGRTIKIGDLVVSSSSSSPGYYGSVSAVASQTSVTVVYIDCFVPVMLTNISRSVSGTNTVYTLTFNKTCTSASAHLASSTSALSGTWSAAGTSRTFTIATSSLTEDIVFYGFS